MEGNERRNLVAGVLFGVAFSLLGQACYDILKEGITPVVPAYAANFVILVAAVIPASFFMWLGIREYRRK